MKKLSHISCTLLFFLALLGFNKCFAQSPINPTNFNGLKLWLVADSVNTVSGGFVNTCKDISGNNNHATQTNPSLMPLHMPSNLNGHATILFDGVDDFLTFSTITDARTVFWIIKENNNATANYRSLMGDRTAYDFIRGDNKEIWNSTYTNSFILNSSTRLNSNSINGTSQQLGSDFSLISLVTTGNVTGSNFSSDRLISNRVWDGELAELIIYNEALTPTQVIQIEQYLNDKYAPPAQLPNDISINNSICDTILEINNSYKNKYSNIIWSTGATSPTVSINKSGKYWVKATNIFGKESSDTIVVQFPELRLPSQNQFCKNQSLDWNTQLSKQLFNFQWSNGSTDSLININQPGDYFVKITDSFGCSITSDTITITQDDFSTNASLGPDISLCSGNSITLKQGLQPNLTYTWSTGQNAAAITVTNTGQYAVAVTNTNNCVGYDTIQVNIIGDAPKADFSYSNPCVKSVVSFSNSSNAPPGNIINSYHWNFENRLGSVNSSTLTNPFYTYFDTGHYNVQLQVKTNVGCEQTITKTIHIAPTPTVNFTNGLACQKDSTVFTNLSLGSNSYSVTSLYWNFGDPGSGFSNVSTSYSPKHLFTNRGNHSIKLIATNEVGCKDSITKSIFIKDQVSADFFYHNACLNQPTFFQDQSIAPVSSTRLWNFGNYISNGLTTTHTYSNTGISSVTLTVNGTNGCMSKTTKSVTVYLPPVSSFSVPDFCVKDTVYVFNNSLAKNGNIVSHDWKMNNVSFSALSNPILSAMQSGIIPIRLTVMNSFNCSDSLTKNITVFPLPLVDFSIKPNSFYYIDSLITFYPSITNVQSYTWHFNGQSYSHTLTPSTTFSVPGTYTCSLLIENQQGCKNEKNKTISVQKHYLDVAVLNIQTLEDTDGYLIVKTDIANYGTVPVNSMQIHYRINDGGNIKESWNGALNPNTITTYTFHSKSADQNNKTNKITCVEVEKVNETFDRNSQNNYLCNVLNSNETTVLNPLPNPTDGDVTIPIVLNKETTFSISIIHSTGQTVYPSTVYQGNVGLNFINLPTASYARGSYIIEVKIEEQVFMKKIIKNKRD